MFEAMFYLNFILLCLIVYVIADRLVKVEKKVKELIKNAEDRLEKRV